VIANLAVRLSNRSRTVVNKISLSQIDFAPLHERVYAEVRQAVIAGKFAPGQKLTSRKLAAALGTSDMPVRAAISRLTAEGGLVRMANSTFVVPVLGRQQFKEVMELRALLESRAASLASGEIDREGFKRLQRHSKDLDEASKREDIVAYLDANQKLKFTIYGYCESPALTALIEMLWLRVGPALRFHLTVLKRITRFSYHHQAIKALEQKRAKAAGEWISRDILEGMQSLLSVARFADDKTEALAQK
jgi:DNA-binding GntR family transcriptional regulator